MIEFSFKQKKNKPPVDMLKLLLKNYVINEQQLKIILKQYKAKNK